MTNNDELANSIDFVYQLTMTVMGQQQACEHLLSAVIAEVVEKSPELLPSIKERFTDVAELHRVIIESKVLLDSYDTHVTKLTRQFNLMNVGDSFQE
jgi:hypothetical protein